MTILFALVMLLAACNISQEEALPPQHFTVGLVIPHEVVLGVFDNYRAEMAALGYIEGQNITYIQKGPPETIVDLLQMPSQLAAEEVDLMVVVAPEGALLAQGASEDIPIIFMAGDAPVEAGLVESLSRPGGNITGITATGPDARRLELLLEVVPDMKAVYVPHTVGNTMANNSLEEIEEAAEDFGLELLAGEVRNESEVQAAIQNIPDEADAIFIPQDLLVSSQIAAWADQAIARKLPISVPGAGQAQENDYPTTALMGYGLNVEELAQRSARLSDQIFRGASPGDLPIEAAEFYLMVNIDTANAIGIEIPDHILEQAHFITNTGVGSEDQ